MFEVETTRLNWKNYAMNLGYGIKRYILHQSATLPAAGYNNIVQRMIQHGSPMPWSSIKGLPIKTRSREDMCQLILSRDSVQAEIAKLVKVKLEYYRGTLHIDTSEDKVYHEVSAKAQADIDTICSDYDHKILTGMA